MRHRHYFVIPCFLLIVSNCFAGKLDFNRDIRPILSDKCFKCHGPDAKNQKSKLRLDSFENATKNYDGLLALVPGKLKESEIHWRIRSDDASEVMPPPNAKLPLTKAEKDLIDQWITEGGEYRKHWSFEPLAKHSKVPKSEHPEPHNAIDHFIAEGLSSSGLKPSTEVDRATWIRRVSFDLTGLPPTLSELDTFLADTSEDAYEKVLERLLHSEAYAERMTAEWLDVARYADTYGYQVDRNRNVWPWRDWVLRAFRDNLSFDKFVTWQIAGDLLPNATSDQILATCFNRLHSQKVEGGSVPEEFRIEYVADRVHTFGTAFLGLTFECTRCHDHKYDPITQRDYYSLSAFFNNIDEAGLYSYFTGSVPTPTLELGELPSDEKIKSSEAELRRIAKSVEAREAFKQRDENFEKNLLVTYPPVAHLAFEEIKGGKFTNLADSKRPAGTGGKNTIESGKVGNAVRLTGDHAVSLPKGLGDFNRHQSFSLALWIKPTEKLDRAVVLRRSKAWTDAASRGYELLLEDGMPSAALIHFWPGNAIRVLDPQPLSLGEWTHVAVTYDGSSRASGLNLYRNGLLVDKVVSRDHLTREITGGGDPFLAIGQRMRDRGFKNGLVDELYVFDRELSLIEVGELAGISQPVADDQFQAFLRTSYKPYQDQLIKLSDARKSYGNSRQRLTEIMVMKEMPATRETHILNRGLYSDRGEVVGRATPVVLPPMPSDLPKNRLGLAQWLTSPDHPLLARVTVNRYWQMLFGRGLVSTSEDFGSQGRPPTHPELLDWLAREFISSGWDLHHLLKTMVLSATYRQSSVVQPKAFEMDPENLLLSRSSAYRLPSEMLRDSSLAVSELLQRKFGGPGVKPYDLKFSFKPINPDRPPNLYRRSVYTFWKRTAPTPLLMTLDSSKRDVCMVRRERTDTASQTLVLLNGPQFVEAARATAQKLIEKHGDNNTQLVENAFRLLTSRFPSQKEREILYGLLKEQEQVFADANSAKAFLSTGEFNAKTEHPTRLAAVTVLVSTLMNFDESISKR